MSNVLTAHHTLRAADRRRQLLPEVPLMTARKPTTPPTHLILPRAKYDTLRKLTEWYEATPDWLDLPDSLSEEIWAEQSDMVPARKLPKDWWVMSVEILTEETAAVHKLQAGLMVALIEPETGATIETPVVLVRGAH